jgi:hypothetical protein
MFEKLQVKDFGIAAHQIGFKGIVSRDFAGTLFLFHWIDLKVVIGPDQV